MAELSLRAWLQGWVGNLGTQETWCHPRIRWPVPRPCPSPQPRHPKRSRQSSRSEHTTGSQEGQELSIEHFPGATELSTTRGRQPHPCPRGAHSLAGERQGKKPGAGRGAAPGQALPTRPGGGPQLLVRPCLCLSCLPHLRRPIPLSALQLTLVSPAAPLLCREGQVWSSCRLHDGSREQSGAAAGGAELPA